MLSLGGFPMPFVLLIVAIALATIVGLIVARTYRTPSAGLLGTLFDMLIVGVVVARLVFVAQYLPLYLADPWSIIRPGDGGYSLWAGLLAGLMFGAWRAHRSEALRRPLAWGTLAGLVAWGAAASFLAFTERANIRVPDVHLTTLTDEPIQLSALTGRPLVVNLWATWCPPCRREMPVLEEAQRVHAEVNFVFVNQGEAADVIRQYLQGESLQLRNVVLDMSSAVAQATGARGLPTTLFFDRDGRLLDAHVGELTQASLAHKLGQFDADAAQP